MRVEKDDPGKVLDYRGPQLLKNRVFLIVAGVLLVLVVAGGIYSLVIFRNRVEFATAPEEPLTENRAADDVNLPITAEVLPQQRREIDDFDRDSWSTFDPAVDPFADPMRLTGVVTGGRGGNMAIIESGGVSNIVAEGEYVDDLWVVRRVYREMVVLRAYDREVSLYFDQPPATRTLDLEQLVDEEEAEEGA